MAFAYKKQKNPEGESLEQESGAFSFQGAITASYSKMQFHESHTAFFLTVNATTCMENF